MSRSLVLGNGNILICLDSHGLVHDVYFPYVGLENHSGDMYIHRIGIWVDGVFSWLDAEGWNIQVGMEKDSLVGNTIAVNNTLGVKLNFNDCVYNEKNVFVRKVKITNLDERKKSIKLFFNQELRIYGAVIGDTAYFDPIHKVMIHYKGRRVFLINAMIDKVSFDDYSVGAFRSKGKEGAYKDAEDGYLCKNAVEHGSVDSVIGITFDIEAKSEKTVFYWIVFAKSIQQAIDLNEYVMEKSLDHIVVTTGDYWRAWVNKENFNYSSLDGKAVELFKKSLLIMRTHIDNEGAIIASADSDMVHFGWDTYGYMWPRDAAFTVIALNKAGYANLSKKFFEFANEIITKEGYFMHKYSPDKSLGSSWHPWVRDGNISLPIQEDETSLVIYALWKYYEETRDLEFIERLYNSLIKRAADFMLFYRDKKTGLPYPTYDLWEEKLGVSTFTSATVYAGLISAAKFATLLGKKDAGDGYNKAAVDLKNSILKYLVNKKNGGFYRTIVEEKNSVSQDGTFDSSSVYGMFKFGLLDVNDKKLKDAVGLMQEKLMCKTPVGGIARYEGDMYFRDQSWQNIPGNPWIINTLWLTQYIIAVSENEEDLEKAKYWINWVVEKAMPTGVLSEQLNPYTGEQLSATPLTWSHAEYVVTVLEYLEKLEQLGVSKVRNEIK